MDALAEMGVLPAYHYRSAVFEDLDKIGAEALRRDHVVKAKACYNCNVYCSRYNVTQYSEGEGPEYEAQAGFTVKCGNADMELGVAASNTVNRLGMDCITTGEIIAWLMECRHEGIITDADVDGIDISAQQFSFFLNLLRVHPSWWTAFRCYCQLTGFKNFFKCAFGFHDAKSSLMILRGPPSRLVRQSLAGIISSYFSSMPKALSLSQINCQAQSTSGLISHFPFVEPPQGPFKRRLEQRAIGQIPPVSPSMQSPQP